MTKIEPTALGCSRRRGPHGTPTGKGVARRAAFHARERERRSSTLLINAVAVGPISSSVSTLKDVSTALTASASPIALAPSSPITV